MLDDAIRNHQLGYEWNWVVALGVDEIEHNRNEVLVIIADLYEIDH